MKKILVILILLANTGFGQMIIPDTSKMKIVEKLMIFQTERKSPTLSAFINIIPTAGYAYAGNWKRGLKIKGAEFLLLIMGSTVFTINSKEVPDSDPFWAERGYKETEYDDFYSSLGLIILLGVPITVVWEFFDVAKTTREYNNQLYKNIFGKEPPLKTNLNPHPKDLSKGE